MKSKSPNCLDETPKSFLKQGRKTFNNSSSSEKEADKEFDDLQLTLLNSFKMKPCDHSTPFYTNDRIKNQRTSIHNLNSDLDDKIEGSNSGYENSSDELSDDCSEDFSSGPEKDKSLNTSDLTGLFDVLTKWFNNLKGGFGYSQPDEQQNNKPCKSSTSNFSIKSSRPLKERRRGKSLNPNFSGSTNKSFNKNDVSTQKISGDLRKDIRLKLKFEQNDTADEWQDDMIQKYAKFNIFIKKKSNFYDCLNSVPGIGLIYMNRLCNKIQNVGTLLEFYCSVDQDTFKCLLREYARVNDLNLNLIYTSCKMYIRKFGFSFADVSICTLKSELQKQQRNDYKTNNFLTKKVYI
jgi:hypothetical protein